jgi:hypothetical protein
VLVQEERIHEVVAFWPSGWSRATRDKRQGSWVCICVSSGLSPHYKSMRIQSWCLFL